MTDLTGKKIAFAVAKEGIEQVELTSAVGGRQGRRRPARPRVRRERARSRPSTTSTRATPSTSTTTFADADPDDYDGLVLPGGVANPDALRTDTDAVAFVKAFFDADKPVAAICHAPVDAGRGRRRPWPHAHLVAEPADRPAQRRRRVEGRGGRRGRQPGDQPQARRPAGLQRGGRVRVRPLNAVRTVGVEEEFLLLDPASGHVVHAAGAVVRGTEGDDTIDGELIEAPGRDAHRALDRPGRHPRPARRRPQAGRRGRTRDRGRGRRHRHGAVRGRGRAGLAQGPVPGDGRRVR